MKQGKKKNNRRSKSQDPTKVADRRSEPEKSTETKAIDGLEGAFASASLADAGYDLGKVAEILAMAMSESSDDPSSSSTSGEASTSVSGSSEGFLEASCLENLMGDERRRNKQKRVVAAAGTVSTVLGKQYMASPRKTKLKGGGFNNGEEGREKDEQFLCSMLGDKSELSLAIVRDVFCQCGYDVEKALDALLELSASSNEQSIDYMDYSLNQKYDNRRHTGQYETADRVFECSECDSIWSVGCTCRRNYADVLASSEPRLPTGQDSSDSHLSQKVLESFFQVSKGSEQHKPGTMNWRNVVKKMQLLGPHFDVCPSDQSEETQNTAKLRKEDEYQVLRKPANQEWESVRSYYQKAATAYSKGSKEYAGYLADQGRVKTKLAREADERASKDIFKARNKEIQNVITVDLHGQHVDQAMRLLKMHLVLVSYVQTVQTLRVITGCGTHGMGRSKLKQSVVKLLEKEGIEWKEENQGTVLIKLCGQREFNFLDCESE